ncbi:amino acid transporter [Acetobacter aceti]|uniref:amino acid transporter n=1 Tax=Acetobacter aceti TaxID=435 RepID=UPI002152FAA1|nr:amino acid transporter [Acetobacter aceti]
MDHPHISSPEDDARLEALGVKSDFDRSMSMLENFALGFAYLSPVVSVYTLFDSSLQTGGSPMIYSFSRDRMIPGAKALSRISPPLSPDKPST